MSTDCIQIRGAFQNNLRHIDLDLPLRELIVITGVSGSGKSSLAFDTLYAEGQRRYVETFSAYARQFLERMDKPRVDSILGIPPAIAIDQTNPVRTSRSTVGTMTELNDHLKLLFARFSRLLCGGCGREVRRDTPDSVFDQIVAEIAAEPAAGERVALTFAVPVPESLSSADLGPLLEAQGFRHVVERVGGRVEVVHSRPRVERARRGRVVEDIESALTCGHGQISVRRVAADGTYGPPWRFSADLRCPDCDLRFADPVPNLFSFNSPIGACPTCRGFGRVIGVDYDLVIPDAALSLRQGAVRPWQGGMSRECQDDMLGFATLRRIPVDRPWRELSAAQQRWVIEGEGPWEDGKWYGIRRFFEYLESKAYKMHIRVLLSRYRSYQPCPVCQGTRLKPEALLWRLGPGSGLHVHALQCQPIDQALAFFRELQLPGAADEAATALLSAIRTRLGYLVDVGLGYLTLDRQSRTLSGGEVQRINLTTALGTSLVNTLFVLDEPSVGLHPRDIDRLIGVLRRLRDAGNTLVVVEHDPAVIRAADRVVDMGPGPGEQGGRVVYAGGLSGLLECRESLTAQYLSGARQSAVAWSPLPVAAADPALVIRGAAEHNLKGIDVRLPLQRLVCLTGVSGSGKSTLVQDILYPALCKLTGRAAETAGAHRGLEGYAGLQGVELVDQSPIGRTTRSNPASYVGVWDAIRALFAGTDLARRRGYTAGTFSFNSGTGRCPACSGNGFQHVEMQFLSDVYLRCPDCAGRRYVSEVLEVRLADGRSIADVLELTVAEACQAFAGSAAIAKALEPLRAVGLGYVRLGQPVPTLSGGEAQRLKLAGHLAAAAGRRGAGPLLFLFDEPTTGLHFQDTERLLRALRRLLEEGHSVLVIEHNLDVIGAADWVIDLGPEGGAGGGEIVCQGTPEQVMAHAGSHTGAALREYRASLAGLAVAEAPMAASSLLSAAGLRPDAAVHIRNAREHNLKGIDVRIPHGAFTVITGVSGSGKSTVAFNILFAEGQRRYLESLNAYARQFVQPAARPDVDAVSGVPPTVAIEQRTSRGGQKSTVATVTEIHHFLRLLFVKLGTQFCPDCEVPIQPQSAALIAARIAPPGGRGTVRLFAPLVSARKGVYTDLAKWAAKKGFERLRVDGELLPTVPWPRLDRYREHDIALPVASLDLGASSRPAVLAAVEATLAYGEGLLRCAGPGDAEVVYSTRRSCPGCGRSFPELDPRLFSYNSHHGWCPGCFGTGLQVSGFDAEQSGEEARWDDPALQTATTCPECSGRRLRPEALAVRFQGRSIADFGALAIVAAEEAFAGLQVAPEQAEIARDIVSEIRSRLVFLRDVGLAYLTLDRAAPTLSGGEAQRIRLAAQLGSNLRGVCYVLDEPTIGLHSRDNRMLLQTLRRLQGKGNTVVVVEHDETAIREADHIIDLGPGAGVQGGQVVAAGTPAEICAHPLSVTGRFLREPLRHPLAGGHRPTTATSTAWLRLRRATLHNLRHLDVALPLGRFVCVTGVSGSGKSTLVGEVLRQSLANLLAARFERRPLPKAGHGCQAVAGWEPVGRVLEVDQTPIGKTPRSCPATYVGFWDDIRRLFAAVPEARLRGWKPGRFSFNVEGGRCPECEGQGVRRIEMSFLPDVTVLCEACRGRRFTPEAMGVTFKGKSVADVLAMSVDEAAPFFAAQLAIQRPLLLLQEVGLGYLTLGQPSPTLSGGEAQRIKLVTELAKARGGTGSGEVAADPKAPRSARGSRQTLYVLDEPTIGLHMADVEKLLCALQRLVDAGHTVVIIEHNLDVIAEADWIIDLGPEGGDGGGRVVCQGPPLRLARARTPGHTAAALREFLQRTVGASC
jgi:excinuclease ABC subunit A